MLLATNMSVISFIKSHSYFSKQNNNVNDLCHSTRKHCTYQQYGKKDIDEAYRVKNLLEKEFSNIEVEVSTCDEWVSLFIYLN